MNRIHYRYLFLMALNIVAAFMCIISFVTCFGQPIGMVNGGLALLNAGLLAFNFWQMNVMLKRDGYEPVTMKSIKFSPAVSAFLLKYLYK